LWGCIRNRVERAIHTTTHWRLWRCRCPLAEFLWDAIEARTTVRQGGGRVRGSAVGSVDIPPSLRKCGGRRGILVLGLAKAKERHFLCFLREMIVRSHSRRACRGWVQLGSGLFLVVKGGRGTTISCAGYSSAIIGCGRVHESFRELLLLYADFDAELSSRRLRFEE
jgi:hypothetical protein